MKLGAMKEPWVRRGTARRIAPLSMGGVRSIAIIKHAALGDLVHTRPMLTALRRHFGNAKLTFSALEYSTNGVPYDLVDEVHISRKKHGLKDSYRSMQSLGAQDIIFDLTQSGRSHWLTLMTPATLKIGFKHKGLERLVYDVAIARAEFRFEAETFFEPLNVLGLPLDAPLDYAYQPIAPPLKGSYIIYFPTASSPSKSWEQARFTQLIDQACTRYPQYQHVLLSGLAEWEQAACTTIHNALGHHKQLTRFDGGEQTEALLANAHCLVSNDTGIRNLAIARGTPTLGIFIPQLLMGYLPRFGIHEVIYDHDSGMPSVQSVSDAFDTLMGRLNELNPS